jgi:hypothetical protein
MCLGRQASHYIVFAFCEGVKGVKVLVCNQPNLFVASRSFLRARLVLPEPLVYFFLDKLRAASARAAVEAKTR